jgi:hypothetical protein
MDFHDIGKESLEVNSVLCFLCNKIDNYPRKLLKSTVLGFFRDDEILCAKQTLHQICVDHNKIQHVQQFVKRRIGENKKKAIVDDILNILYTLDELGPLDFLPVFCVADTSRIPTLTDEMSDMAYVKKVIDELQSQLSDVSFALLELKSVSCSKITSCCSVETQTDDFIPQPAAAVQTATATVHADGTQTGDLVAHVMGDLVHHGSTVKDIDAENIATGSSLLSGSNMIPGSNKIAGNQKCAGPSYSDAARLGVAVAAAVPHVPLVNTAQQHAHAHQTDNNEEGFVPVIGHRNQRRRNVVVGVGRSTPLTGIEKKAVVCVNRLSPTTTAEHVTNYLRDSGIHVFTCSLVQKRVATDTTTGTDLLMETDNSKSKRFISMRICISQSDLARIMSSELWPIGVTVRPWTFKARSSNSNNSNDNSGKVNNNLGVSASQTSATSVPAVPTVAGQ